MLLLGLFVVFGNIRCWSISDLFLNQPRQIVRHLLHSLSGNLFGAQDLVQDIRYPLISLLIAKYLSLVNAEEELDIQTIDILQQVLTHGFTGLGECHQPKIRVRALEFAPVGISVAA